MLIAMDFPPFLLIVFLSFFTSGSGLLGFWAPADALAEGRSQPHFIDEFDPAGLLDAGRRTSKIYTKAMVELKRLEEEPLCHRTATKLLLNNCQGLEDISQADYQLHSGRMQRHHVESLAATLAICDMENRFIIPDSCSPFRMPALLRASEVGNGSLNISFGEIGVCVEALGKDHSHWNTWLSYRDTALLLCQASRLDIEKDQTILLHKKLMNIITAFSDGLVKDLREMKRDMARQLHEANAYFESMKLRAEEWRVTMHGILGGLSVDINDAREVLKASKGSAIDMQRVINMTIETTLHRNAQVAVEQEEALVLSTSKMESRLQYISVLAENTEDSIMRLRSTIDMLLPVMESVGERQEFLDKKMEALSITVVGINALLQNHTESLHQASFTATEVHSILESTALAAVDTMAASFQHNSRLVDWVIRIGGPFMSVFLGNYKITPSLSQNALLILSGYFTGEMVVHTRHCDWQKMALRIRKIY